MSKGVLALTVDGKLTYCVAPPEMRGKGRCNHVAHQEEGQSQEDFINSLGDKIKTEDESEPEIQRLISKVVTDYSKRTIDPDWEEMLRSLDNPFVIGKESDGSYEEAKLLSVSQDKELSMSNEGYVQHIVAKYEFRGKEFECDYGYVPAVNEDGTITINGVDWRVLPVVDQNKAGVISYDENIVVKQDDGRNIAFIMSKDPESTTCNIYGKFVPIDTVKNFLATGDTTGLDSGQIYALSHIDPVAFERFPNLATDLENLKNLEPDNPADLEWRRTYGYKDIVAEQFRLQQRRMGVTFRNNLAKRQNLEPDDPLYSGFDEKYPLFYQVNLSDNIKKTLVGRSNVQYADNLNPISALSQSQKISFTGPGGYHKDKVPHILRLPDKSHEFTIDTMDVSSGKNVGLTATLSKGYIDERGFIKPRSESDKQLSPSDFIPFRSNDDPNRGVMAVAHMKQACPIIGGEDPLPLGDSTSDNAWSQIKGAKLGCELMTAYIPMDGNYEDAVIISESAAKKMATIQSHKYSSRPYDEKEPTKPWPENWKVGDRVERKMRVHGEEIKNGGIITSIDDNGFTVETTYKMTPGDKLAGRHGNKSVVSKVLPDSEMPKVWDEHSGRLVPSQVIMSPISVVGRKNLGQIMECNQSMGDGATIDKTRRAVLNNGKQIEITAGRQYIMRLNHIAEKKLASHAEELGANREAEGSRVGEMEAILLSQNEDRLKILDYLRHQEAYDSHNKLNSLLKSVGVKMEGVNWEE